MSGSPAHLESHIWKIQAAAQSSRVTDRVQALVARYPHVSGAEAAEILNYVKRARYADMELLASDESLRSQLDAFLKAHKRQLRYSAVEIVTIIAMIVAFLAICWVLWHPLGGA